MNYSNKAYVEHLRRKYPPGTRLQLNCMEDEFPVPPGSMGTVESVSYTHLRQPKRWPTCLAPAPSIPAVAMMPTASKIWTVKSGKSFGTQAFTRKDICAPLLRASIKLS